MAKPAKPSPFDALVQARTKPVRQVAGQTSKQSDSQTANQPDVGDDPKLAKSADSSYLKFTTYIRKQTHRAVKLKLLEQDREFSDLVEELLSDWLQRQIAGK